MKRECGDCQLCCKLLPVKGINKPALTRCPHQRHHKGCAVYHKPEKGFPWECGLWNCAWLQNIDAAELRRPDRSNYVIDVMPDYLTAEGADGQNIVLPAVQIWADPKYPDCHRDPELRAWLVRRRGFVGLVRYGAYDAITLIPPYMMENGEWLEKRNGNVLEKTHSFGQVLEALSTVG
jgi:hypothetical protein